VDTGSGLVLQVGYPLLDHDLSNGVEDNGKFSWKIP